MSELSNLDYDSFTFSSMSDLSDMSDISDVSDIDISDISNNVIDINKLIGGTEPANTTAITKGMNLEDSSNEVIREATKIIKDAEKYEQHEEVKKHINTTRNAIEILKNKIGKPKFEKHMILK